MVKCATILAGGKSSRMQREKALLEVEGQTLIARTATILRPLFSEIVVVTSKAEVAAAAGLAAIPDQYPDCGPLGGIHSALKHFEQTTFVVACDMPYLNPAFIREMQETPFEKALIPRHENGIEPLHGIYSPQCLPIFEQYLISGQKIPSFKHIFSEIDVTFIATSANLNFENWNFPSDIR